MTNYNERLERARAGIRGILFSYSDPSGPNLHESTENAMAEITQLFKDLVAEAKPEMPYEKLKSCPVCGEPQYNHSGDVHFDYGVNQYEENLLKALEEV